ncbi:hypothetical protein NC651_028222 [Populus alba x Populus x berolinensis]|nr:hypothetical protein NC651_028222 [Populus alba x Populus x berolinensis]
MRTVEEKALALFKWMRKSGKVCGKLGALSEGMAVHGILDNESWLALLKPVDSQNISCVGTTLHAH